MLISRWSTCSSYSSPVGGRDRGQNTGREWNYGCFWSVRIYPRGDRRNFGEDETRENEIWPGEFVCTPYCPTLKGAGVNDARNAGGCGSPRPFSFLLRVTVVQTDEGFNKGQSMNAGGRVEGNCRWGSISFWICTSRYNSQLCFLRIKRTEETDLGVNDARNTRGVRFAASFLLSC